MLRTCEPDLLFLLASLTSRLLEFCIFCGGAHAAARGGGCLTREAFPPRGVLEAPRGTPGREESLQAFPLASAGRVSPRRQRGALLQYIRLPLLRLGCVWPFSFLFSPRRRERAQCVGKGCVDGGAGNSRAASPASCGEVAAVRGREVVAVRGRERGRRKGACTAVPGDAGARVPSHIPAAAADGYLA